MTENEKQEFIRKEIEAIYEEIDITINSLILSRRFLKQLVDVANGAEPDYQLSKLIKRIK